MTFFCDFFSLRNGNDLQVNYSLQNLFSTVYLKAYVTWCIWVTCKQDGAIILVKWVNLPPTERRFLIALPMTGDHLFFGAVGWWNTYAKVRILVLHCCREKNWNEILWLPSKHNFAFLKGNLNKVLKEKPFYFELPWHIMSNNYFIHFFI